MPSHPCEHGKRKSYCRVCGGSAFCEHGKQKAKCRECGAGGSAPNPNTGALLLGFLRRFGHDFDYGRMAVAAARASGVTRAKDLVVHPGAFGRRPMVLAEDPQVGWCKLNSRLTHGS